MEQSQQSIPLPAIEPLHAIPHTKHHG